MSKGLDKRKNAFSAVVSGGDQQARPTKTRERKATYTVTLPPELLEKSRDVAWWDRDSVSGVFVKALEALIAEREEKRGEPYPPREGEIKTGRPQEK